MTKRKVWRYRCDFCKKSGCSGGHMARHERTCTANPNRACEMHKHCGDPQKPVAELVAILTAHSTDKNWKAAMDKLRDAASHCPACILAAIRQSGLQKGYADEEGYVGGADFEFDFRTELKSFWEDINLDERDGGYY